MTEAVPIRDHRREQLPNRRFGESFELEHGGKRGKFVVTLGRYADGRVGEIFIAGGKSGTEVEANVCDTAILASLAIQHGVPIATLAAALTREFNGAPSTIIGVVLERLAQQLQPHAFVPSAMHMGDCAMCGHLQGDPIHKVRT